MYRSTTHHFLNKTIPLEEANFIILGSPLDHTTSYRSGQRFGPNAIRRASAYLETISLRTGLDWESLLITDLGDIELSDDLKKSLKSIEDSVKDVSKKNKIPFQLGGEHTITLAAMRALKPELAVVFDAHLDVRNTLFNRRICHGTYLRRANEELGMKIIVLGARSLSREESKYAEDHQIQVVTSRDIDNNGVKHGIEIIQDSMDRVESAYLSIDMDSLDPSQAPAVGNPSPEGLTVTQILDIIHGSINRKIIGFDLNEVTPLYDSGLTSIQAAYIVMETLYAFEAARSQRVY